MHEGVIVRLNLDKGFGFIASPGQPDAFFHFKDLGDELEFDGTLEQRSVRFDLTTTSKGLRAVNVRPA